MLQVDGLQEELILPSPSLNIPSIPEDHNLTQYYNSVDSDCMMEVFASLLCERRVVVTSRSLGRLSSCVLAANSLLHPLVWQVVLHSPLLLPQHILIPLLPPRLVDYLAAPVPYLIGVPGPLMARVPGQELEEVVLLDIDNNTVYTPYDDLASLPGKVADKLRARLQPGTVVVGDGVARAFLRTIVHILGGYRTALTGQEGDALTLDEDAFLTSRTGSVQPFLERMLQVQHVRQFLQDRLDLINNGMDIDDEFEQECERFTKKEKKKLKNKYSTLSKKAKKQGSKIALSIYTDVRTKIDEGKRRKRTCTLSAPSSPTMERKGGHLGQWSNQMARRSSDFDESLMSQLEEVMTRHSQAQVARYRVRQGARQNLRGLSLQRKQQDESSSDSSSDEDLLVSSGDLTRPGSHTKLSGSSLDHLEEVVDQLHVNCLQPKDPMDIGRSEARYATKSVYMPPSKEAIQHEDTLNCPTSSSSPLT